MTRPDFRIPLLIVGCVGGGLALNQPLLEPRPVNAADLHAHARTGGSADCSVAALAPAMPERADRRAEPASPPAGPEAAAEAAEAVLTRALGQGVWTEDDANALRMQLVKLSADGVERIIGTFTAALNGQCLALRTTGAPL